MENDQTPLNTVIQRYYSNGMFDCALHYSKEYVLTLYDYTHPQIARSSDLDGRSRHFKLLYLCQRYQEIIELYKTYFYIE